MNLLLASGLLASLLLTLPGCTSGKVISTVQSPVEPESRVMTTAEESHTADNNPVAEVTPSPTPDLPTAETFPPLQSSGGPPASSPALSASMINPPAEWAAQELARRGFVRDPSKKVVVLDPGHGGPDVGAAAGSLAEKSVNLEIALKLKGLLEADGYQVLLTRESDQRPYTLAQGRTDRPVTRADLQARVDLANTAQADVFISMHNNGSSDPAQAGTEVWYAPDRSFGDANWRLAQAILDGIVSELAKTGYPSPNRGLKNGSEFRVFNGRVFPFLCWATPVQTGSPAEQRGCRASWERASSSPTRTRRGCWHRSGFS